MGNLYFKFSKDSWVLNTLPPLLLLQLILKVPSWDPTLKTHLLSLVCHSSQPELNPSSANALPQMFGKNAKIRKISSVTPSSKLSSQELSGLNQVLVSTPDPTIPTMLSPHLWIKLSMTITVTPRLISISHPWMSTNLSAHHSQRMRTR